MRFRIIDFIVVVTSSYRRAVLTAFNTTGGNDALRRQYYSPYVHPFERFIHLFSAAYLLGFVASLIVINIRWIIDLPIRMTKKALGNNTFSPHEPNWGIAQFVFGFPGIVVGFIMGLVPSIIILVGRGVFSVPRVIRTIVLDTIISLIDLSVRMMNMVLAAEDRISLPNQEYEFKLTGILGFPLGVVTGLVGGSIISVGRVFLNTIKTARDLSGGIFNVALRREIFVGLENRRAVNARWRWGVLGILLAIPVGCVGVGILVVRKLPLLIGVAFSPVVMTFRLLHESYKYMTDSLRFSKKTPHAEHEIEQQIARNNKHLLKALFAGLTPLGELPVGKEISPSKEGPTYYGSIKKTMNWSSFQKLLRKSATFNQRSLTELVLHEIYEGLVDAFNRQLNNRVDVGEVILHAIAKVKLSYQTDATLITPQSKKKRNDEEVDKVADYVRKILTEQNLELPVPAIYHENVARHLFFSQHIVESAVAVPVATPGVT